MADSMSPLTNESLPVWARIMTWVGVPSAAFAWILYWLTTTLSAQIATNTLAIKATNDLIAQHESARQTDSAVLRYYLFGVCLNTATNEAARSRCADPSGSKSSK